MNDLQAWMRRANRVGGNRVQADSGKAIDAMAAAFPDFAAVDLMNRAGLLWKLQDTLMENSGSLAEFLTVEAPFGGIKESGIGKEGRGQGLEDYLDTRYVCIDGI